MDFQELAWGKGMRLAWLEDISFDIPNNVATIKHFGVTKDFVGLGIGTRVIFAFGSEIKSKHGITHICFDERSQDPAYRPFFLSRLKAKEQPSPDGQGLSWLWQIP